MTAGHTETTPDPAPKGFWAELGDAISVRTMALISGVLLLQLGFILSYVGAFHAPAPQRIPIAVVAPAQISAQVVAKLNAVPSHPPAARAVSPQQQAEQLIRTGALPAALVVNPSAGTGRLLVASAAGTSEATAVEQVVAALEAREHRTAAGHHPPGGDPAAGHDAVRGHLRAGRRDRGGPRRRYRPSPSYSLRPHLAKSRWGSVPTIRRGY